MAVRLWAGLVLFAVLLLTAAGFIHNGVAQQDRSVDGLVGRLHPLEIANLEVRADFAQAQSVLRAYLLTREARFLSQYRLDNVALALALGQARDLAADGEIAGIAAENRAALTWLGYAGQMESRRAGSPALSQLTDQASNSAQNFNRASDRLQARLEAEGAAAVSSGAQAVDHAVTVASVFATVAALLGLAAALAIILGVTGPLRGLVAILRRLTAGDHGARAPVTGPAETREVAQSLNALADESDRLRAQEAETNRLRADSTGHRAAGPRASAGGRPVARGEGRDRVEFRRRYRLPAPQARRGAGPAGRPRGRLALPGQLPCLSCGARATSCSVTCSGATRAWCTRTSRARRRPAAAADPGSAARGGNRRGGDRPVRAGSEMLGIIVAARMSRGRPWTEAEVGAVESVAADVGRGLHHARLFEAENRLVDELRAVDQVKSNFLATVSHELRTPLTSIAGYIEILRDRTAGPLTPAQDRMLDSVDRNTARLRHLIEDVLTLSKIESGAFTSMMRPVSLTEIVAADVTALQPAAAAKGLTLNWQDSGSQPDGQR